MGLSFTFLLLYVDSIIFMTGNLSVPYTCFQVGLFFKFMSSI
jgi:hypothetical protein